MADKEKQNGSYIVERHRKDEDSENWTHDGGLLTTWDHDEGDEE